MAHVLKFTESYIELAELTLYLILVKFAYLINFFKKLISYRYHLFLLFITFVLIRELINLII